MYNLYINLGQKSRRINLKINVYKMQKEKITLRIYKLANASLVFLVRPYTDVFECSLLVKSETR